MLISFSVANFRSFGEEQTLNMVASGKQSDHPEHLVPIGNTGKSVVRSTILYGANASGKSNLISAMKVALDIIRGKSDALDDVHPFRFGRTSEQNPSSFEFRVLVDEVVYVYGFDVLPGIINSEWLAIQNTEREVEVVTRDADGNATVGDDAKRHVDDLTHSVLTALCELPVKQSTLFLKRLLDVPRKALGASLAQLMSLLSREIRILRPIEFPIPFQLAAAITRLDRNADLVRFTGDFLANVGTGISRVEVRQASPTNRAGDQFLVSIFTKLKQDDESSSVADGDSPTIPKLYSIHTTENGSQEVSFDDESDGTKVVVGLLPFLHPATRKATVLVIDEFDRSLHPHLCWEIIRFFSETEPGAHKQLIATTHEAHLLNQDLLRRDEYWFVEKDDRQQSQLVSLSDFKVRNDLQLEKGYLQGRFGGIPFIGSMEHLMRMLNEPRVDAHHEESLDAPQAAPAGS